LTCVFMYFFDQYKECFFKTICSSYSHMGGSSLRDYHQIHADPSPWYGRQTSIIILLQCNWNAPDSSKRLVYCVPVNRDCKILLLR
jgi:hypothetical protein